MHVAWKTTLAIAVAAAMTAPIAQAEWYAFGSFEPDTQYDLDWGFSEPAPVGASQIYFNAFSTYEGVTPYGLLNPNVGTLNTQIEVTNDEYHYAMLGVWKDCNGDGYVGIAESALREYPASLLASTDACPPASGAATDPWPGAHNYNGWVSEFVTITEDGLNNIDRRTYRDAEARVWGDYHRPDEQPFHRSCALNPQPRGTYKDTGGLVNFVDCRVDLLGPANDVNRAIGDPLGLTFSDEDDAHSGTLGNIPVGGDESSDHALVYTADCSQPATNVGQQVDSVNPTVGALTPAAVRNRNVNSVAVSVDETPEDTSLAGQMNATMEERGTGATADCNYQNDGGGDLYNTFEADFNGVNPKNKTEADWNFGTLATQRGGQPYQHTGAVLGWNGAAGAPVDHGKGFGTIWGSDSTWLSKTGPRSVRVDLDNGGVEIAPAYWLTFYAKVGQATLDRGFAIKATSPGTYGSWHCGGVFDASRHPSQTNGWNCDPNVWYINPDGTFPPATTLENLAKPGWKYNFRDVDCYDGRIGDTGVAVEPAFYGSQPCITP